VDAIKETVDVSPQSAASLEETRRGQLILQHIMYSVTLCLHQLLCLCLKWSLIAPVAGDAVC
jgi:hypothetical protein